MLKLLANEFGARLPVQERMVDSTPELYMATENDLEFCRKQAEHCRWLARNTADLHISSKLHDMARDFDERAATIERSSISN
jgi:hypothetical protein